MYTHLPRNPLQNCQISLHHVRVAIKTGTFRNKRRIIARCFTRLDKMLE